MFNFFYQSGEFSDSGGMSIGEIVVQLLVAFIGAGAAILVFYLQSRNDRSKQLALQENFENDSIKYLYHLMSGAMDVIEAFSLSINQSVQAFEQSDKSQLPIIEKHSFNDLDRIVNKINQEQYYHALLKRIKREKIEGIFSGFDFFYGSMNFIETNTDNQYEIFKALVSNFEKSLISSAESVSKYIGKLKREGKRDTELFNRLNNSLKEYVSIVEENKGRSYVSIMFIMRDRFLYPLVEYIVYLEEKDEEVEQLGYTLSNTNKLIEPIIIHNKAMVENLEQFNEELIKGISYSKTKIVPITEYINKLQVNVQASKRSTIHKSYKHIIFG